MSHVVAIKTEITDIPAFKAACKELGLVFKENQKTHRWYGRFMNDYDAEQAAHRFGIKPEDYGKCEHAVEVPGSGYDIGLVKNPKGKGFLMAFDFWGTGKVIQEKIGNEGGLMTQRYALCKTEMMARAKGIQTTREVQKGKIVLRAYGPRL